MADVNNDGLADIVGFGDHGVYVSRATGQGHFGNPTLELAAFGADAGGWLSNDSYPRVLADVNGDGRADIVGFGSRGVYVSLATGDGHFLAPTFELAAFGTDAGSWNSNNLYPRVLADVNGDGMADIVAFGDKGVSVSLATGNGHFGNPTFELANLAPSAGGWSSNDEYPRMLADVNRDGKADIVAFGSRGVYVAEASGNGHFNAPTLRLEFFGSDAGSWTSNDTYPRSIADVNGDGTSDIVGFGEHGTYVAYGRGDGFFDSITKDNNQFGAGADAGGWQSANLYPRMLADVTGDHRADIVGFANAGVYVSHVFDIV